MIIYFILSVFLMAVDQATKFFTVSSVPLGGDGMTIIKNVLSVTYCQNTGGSWGFLSNHQIFLILATIIVLIGASLYIIKAKPKSRLFRLGASLVYAGALSNLADRLLRGFVVDMIRTDFMDFPIFNIADCCVVVGMALICIFVLTDK